MKASKRDLVGRRIAAVDFRPFPSHPQTNKRARAHDPVLTLDNGRRVWFVTEETEVGEYGTSIAITDKEKQKDQMKESIDPFEDQLNPGVTGPIKVTKRKLSRSERRIVAQLSDPRKVKEKPSK